MKRLYTAILFCVCVFMPFSGYAQTILQNDFSQPNDTLEVVGRGDCYIADGVFHSKSAYALFGNPGWKNYSVSFKARASKDAEQVQIWAGFRAYNRFDRYVLGVKGGLQDDIYLSRMGYMGTDELLDIRPLDFHPVPGVWYNFKIEVCGERIRVFLNNETLPRIDIIDKNSNLAPAGYVTLGGGWIETEFDNLKIEELTANAFEGIAVKTYEVKETSQQKESKRQGERAGYQPKKLSNVNSLRTEISLDGNWLFMPDYQVKDKTSAVDPQADDGDWHVMSVPNFWTPIRIWLHGETMQPNNSPKGVSDTYYQQETARCEGYTFDYKKVKYAWYRQWVELPENINGKQVLLNFDAVSKAAEVYINGELAASHIGMYGDFQVDGTRLFKPGKNLVAVKVSRSVADNGSKSDDLNTAIDFYYSSVRDSRTPQQKDISLTNNVLKELPHGFYGDNPAGIWQPVSLIITNPVKVQDVFIKPALDGATFDVTLKNYLNKKVKFNILTDIIEEKTGNLFHSEKSLNKLELQPGEERIVTYSINNLRPHHWTPQSPNLYDFTFKLATDKGQELDEMTIRSGFRTFKVENGLFELNGKPYWLRGGNHTPFALAPNDEMLANSFYQIMKAGNIEITRTHTTPYNKLWINAADKNGIGISHEGTWSWLMIHSTMPEMEMIKMWAEEYIHLLKKYRNHPSILFWTINNEMKFYDNEPDKDRRRMKMEIISNIVQRMREVDPTRPISFDSNYTRNVKKHGEAFYEGIDDGDIDDMHSYINWYDHSVFKQFNGEFQKNHKNEGRPLISQEMSTGYPNNETGHPTRFYTLVHQNPQTLVGYEAYAFGNPNAFLNVQAFITGELAEVLRRSNDKASGILHFALLTWFRNVYNSETIDPYPTYYAIKRALQPVLVSAELWGRNFYAGEKIPAQMYIVNDLENGRDLQPTIMHWELVTETGTKLASGIEKLPEVKHYKRHIFTPDIRIPNRLPHSKIKAILKFRLHENGVQVSENEYQILLAEKKWGNVDAGSKKIVVVDYGQNKEALNAIGVKYTEAKTLSEAFRMKANLYFFSGIDNKCTAEEIQAIRDYAKKGGKVIIANSKETAQKVYPEYITGHIFPTEGDIVNMEIPESPVFNDIDLLELRYFNNNKREIPKVCHTALKINRNPNVIELANQTKIHGYINGDMEERSQYVKTIKGFPLLEIKDKGRVLISEMATEKAITDPVTARLLANMIHYLLNN